MIPFIILAALTGLLTVYLWVKVIDTYYNNEPKPVTIIYGIFGGILLVLFIGILVLDITSDRRESFCIHSLGYDGVKEYTLSNVYQCKKTILNQTDNVTYIQMEYSRRILDSVGLPTQSQHEVIGEYQQYLICDDCEESKGVYHWIK